MKALALGLAAAAAAMVVLAFATGGGDPTPPPAAAPQDASSDVHPGFAVWREQGCGGCHTLAAAGATGVIGPDLEASLKGATPTEIERDIVAPAATAAAGYTVGLMPEDYAARMDATDLDALVSYLAASARR